MGLIFKWFLVDFWLVFDGLLDGFLKGFWWVWVDFGIDLDHIVDGFALVSRVFCFEVRKDVGNGNHQQLTCLPMLWHI